MISDWEAMSLKFRDTAQEYYLKNYKKIKLDRDTRMELELMLGLNDSLAINYGHTLEEFADMYSEKEFNKYFGYVKDRYVIDAYELLKLNTRKSRIVCINFKKKRRIMMEILTRCIINMYCNEKCEFREVCPYDVCGNYCNVGKFVQWLADNKLSIEDLIKFSK